MNKLFGILLLCAILSDVKAAGTGIPQIAGYYSKLNKYRVWDRCINKMTFSDKVESATIKMAGINLDYHYYLDGSGNVFRSSSDSGKFTQVAGLSNVVAFYPTQLGYIYLTSAGVYQVASNGAQNYDFNVPFQSNVMVQLDGGGPLGANAVLNQILYGIKANGVLYKFTLDFTQIQSITDTWTTVDLSSISSPTVSKVQSDVNGNIYILTSAGEIYKYTQTTTTWDKILTSCPIPSSTSKTTYTNQGIKSFSVGLDGSIIFIQKVDVTTISTSATVTKYQIKLVHPENNLKCQSYTGLRTTIYNDVNDLMFINALAVGGTGSGSTGGTTLYFAQAYPRLQKRAMKELKKQLKKAINKSI